MSLLKDLINTATRAGKQALEDQVRQQTRNTINSVSNKVGSTVREKIDGGKGQPQGSPAADNTAQTAAVSAAEAPAPSPETPAAETQATQPAQPAEPASAASSAEELRAPIGENSIAGEVGSIFEKVGLGSKSELGEAVKDFEQSTVGDINNALDVLNKATGSNESTTATSLKEAADNFIGAAAKYSDNPIDEAETRAATSAAQSEVDNYKNL